MIKHHIKRKKTSDSLLINSKKCKIIERSYILQNIKMFAKLKKKIALEEGIEGGDLKKAYGPGSGGAFRDDQSSRNGTSERVISPSGSVSSLKDAGSLKSDSKEGGNTMSKAEMLALLNKRSEQVRKLEAKLDEYHVMVKDTLKMKERLELALEKQQDVSMKRLQEANEEFQLKRAKMVEKLEGFVQREEELQEKIEVLNTEKKSLQERLQKLEMSHFIKLEENDELHGFQVQEMAKIKHMFLNSQEELNKCKSELESVRELLRDRSQQLEDKVSELESAKANKDMLQKERETFMSQKMEGEGKVLQLTQQNKALEENVVSLEKELKEKNNKLCSLESNLNALQDSYDAIKHQTSLHSKQTKNVLEEKEITIEQLQEKVSVLEQRLRDNSLSEDDQYKAMEKERDLLDEKLEEARKNLIDNRNTANEKICLLENQISNLNMKMAEDTEELRNKCGDLEQVKISYTSKMNDLQVRLEAAELNTTKLHQTIAEKDTELSSKKSEMESQLLAYQLQIAELKKQSLESRKVLQEKAASLEAQIKTLDTARDLDKNASNHRISMLETVQGEFLEKEIEHEKQISEMEDKQEALRIVIGEKDRECTEIAKELDAVRKLVEALQTKVKETEEHLNNREEEKKQLEKDKKEQDEMIALQEQEKKALDNSKKELCQKIDLQTKQMRAAETESQKIFQEKIDEVQTLKQEISTKDKQINQLNSKVNDLEHTIETSAPELSPEDIQKLREETEKKQETIQGMEEQLIEKNKTIKMQQQRLGDLKKTLQRELKMQTGGGYNSSEEDHRRPRDNHLLDATHMPRVASSPAAMNSISNSRHDVREINFQYLKHVVYKFICSTEMEALQLLKAVSTVLELTKTEEEGIKQIIEWKQSWFGAKPVSKKGFISGR
ncbi:golgin subfamily A member 1-like isoform X2 [Anneissia japonica]|uniref:golgin subfamily A member 1-like isoform X2 n=1 Tax=Anneissia japonica TaxID=1529436 RepID=UPI001425B665|nr:golgin subfamily A member 1-like isoform X2 [Anneissia japonica]